MTPASALPSVLRVVPEIEPPMARRSALSPTRAAPRGRARPDLPSAMTLPPALETGEKLPPILVADDDEDDTFFIQRLIKRTGIENPVRTFDDGTEVVNFLGGARLSTSGGRLRCPRLLFLDLKMRGLGGLGFLEWARQRKELAPLTIVVLSSSNEPAIVAKALELGAHRYLVKYPSVQTITTIVRSVYPLRVF